MNDFLSIFDIYDVTNQLWDKISMKVENDKKMNKRYHNEINVDYDAYKDFNGIINYLQNNSDLGIFHEIKITSSSLYNNDNQYAPSNTIHYQDQNIEFCTSSLDNSWLCFEFCNYKIKPTHYTIRSANYQVNREHPKSWVIEGSNDNKEWIILDEQKDCFSLNGKSVTHTFSITNSTDSKFTFLRMRLIGPNWCKNTKHLNINCIEFYGSLV